MYASSVDALGTLDDSMIRADLDGPRLHSEVMAEDRVGCAYTSFRTLEYGPGSGGSLVRSAILDEGGILVLRDDVTVGSQGSGMTVAALWQLTVQSNSAPKAAVTESGDNWFAQDEVGNTPGLRLLAYHWTPGGRVAGSKPHPHMGDLVMTYAAQDAPAPGETVTFVTILVPFSGDIDAQALADSIDVQVEGQGRRILADQDPPSHCPLRRINMPCIKGCRQGQQWKRCRRCLRYWQRRGYCQTTPTPSPTPAPSPSPTPSQTELPQDITDGVRVRVGSRADFVISSGGAWSC